MGKIRKNSKSGKDEKRIVGRRELRDIRLASNEEKFRFYAELEREQHGKITIEAHKSGFPAVTVFVNSKPTCVTDILSVEDWQRKMHCLRPYIVELPKKQFKKHNIRGESLCNLGVSAKSKEEARIKAAERWSVPIEVIPLRNVRCIFVKSTMSDC